MIYAFVHSPIHLLNIYFFSANDIWNIILNIAECKIVFKSIMEIQIANKCIVKWYKLDTSLEFRYVKDAS